jgi:hypothetical protein
MPALVMLVSALAFLADREPVEQLGRLDHPAIREASGIVQSRRYPGVFWVHNDSGNPPALFAVKRDGSLVREYVVAVPNVDWEDIATDNAGHLYIGEIGNNDGRLPLRAIYRIDEPDPSQPAQGPLPVTLSTFYTFPPKGRFDAEGLYIDGGRAIVVSKRFDEREAELYAIPLDPPAPLFRPALPERIGTLPRFVEPASGADLSSDGRRLAVCSASVARVYQKDGGGGWTLIGEARYQAEGIEAICWDGLDLIIAGEGRGIYRIPEASWRTKPSKPTG